MSLDDIRARAEAATEGPTLPKLAIVDLNDSTLTFDGVKFPHYIVQSGGIDVEGLGDPNALPIIRLGIFAETVEVIPKRKDGAV